LKRVKQPLKFHGGKYYVAQRIIELMPVHKTYTEAFFGGGAVLMAKPMGAGEIVNDIWQPLTHFWKTLQSEQHFRKFRRIVQAIPFSQVEYKGVRQNRPIQQAVEFFIRNRQSRQGLMKCFATMTTGRTRAGMNEQASSWISTVDALPEIHRRLRGVAIFAEDFRQFIPRVDSPDTLHYFDPPYMPETRKVADAYAHEMSVGDHRLLLGLCAKMRGKFILSGYPNHLYEQHRDHYKWHRIDIKIDNKASSAKDKRQMTESLWMNFDPSTVAKAHPLQTK